MFQVFHMVFFHDFVLDFYIILTERILFRAIHLVDMEKVAQMFSPPNSRSFKKGKSFGLLTYCVSTLSILTPSKVAIFEGPTAAT